MIVVHTLGVNMTFMHTFRAYMNLHIYTLRTNMIFCAHVRTNLGEKYFKGDMISYAYFRSIYDFTVLLWMYGLFTALIVFIFCVPFII